MSDLAIRVEKLSKRYRIGQRQHYKTLRDTLAAAIYAPVRALNVAVLRSLTAISTVEKRLPSALAGQDGFIWALKDISFAVKHGEVVGIIGPNGAGKSTLLKILSRITEPTEGYAEIHGRVGSLLEVGTGFHPELTGRDNIYLSGAILGMQRSEIERKFDEIIAFAEVEKFIDAPVKHYSSGMYLRLAFAVAAHLEPEILLVDEVLAVGDAGFQRKCLGKMGDVAKEGRTVLFVSHNMGAITRLCERALLVDGGELIADGPAYQVTEQYQSARLTNRAHWARPESLQASPEFSFISATARDGDGNACSVFRADLPIRLELVYQVHRPLSGCQVGVFVTNSIGVHVFSTADTDSQNVSAIPRVPGKYRAEFSVPGHFLAAGHYTVSFSAHLPLRATYEEIREVITIEVLLTGSLQSLDSRKPVVAPLFMWRTYKATDGHGSE